MFDYFGVEGRRKSWFWLLRERSRKAAFVREKTRRIFFRGIGERKLERKRDGEKVRKTERD